MASGGALGSSDVGSIMGVNKYKSMRKLWQEKSGAIESEFVDNPAVRWGKFKEPYCFHELEFQYNITGFSPKLFVHPKYDFMRVSFDGFNESLNMGVEVKSPYNVKNLIPASEGKIPRQYYPQLQYLLYVSNTPMIKFVTYDGSMKIWIIDVYADPLYQSRMSRYVRHFWHLVQTKTDPKRRKLKHLKIFDQGVTDVP